MKDEDYEKVQNGLYRDFTNMSKRARKRRELGRDLTDAEVREIIAETRRETGADR